MFNSFRRRLPEVSIFHNPSSPPSRTALALLRGAVSGPYPPPSSSESSQTSDSKQNPPLEYNLEVIESPPNIDQTKIILSYLPSKAVSPSMVLLSAHPASGTSQETRPQTVEGIIDLANKNKNALKWPIVVDWNAGEAAIGDVEGVKRILENLRKKRDGEV